MKQLAVAIAAVLSLALVAPAFAQPFADVPTDHWAFDAIAELAAKGMVEGYPDGTFKGDRAMTRYEMAMVVARILARIEAIKIPPPPAAPKIPPPEVTKADLDRLTRLLNEFRAEMSALGVRITAVEEQLAALKARLDNTRITGDVRFRFEDREFPNVQNGFCITLAGCPGFGPNGTTAANNDATFAGSPAWLQFRARTRFRLTYRGQITPDVTAVLRLNTGNVNWSASSLLNIATWDQAYIDWNANLAGLAVAFRIGRQQGIAFGPVGLLLNTDWDGFGTNSAFWYNLDAVRARTSLGPLNLTGVIGRILGGGGPGGWDVWGADANVQLMPGWTAGAYYVRSDAHGANAVIYYQEVGGFQAATRDGSGWGFYVTGTLLPGVTFQGEYARWTPLNNYNFVASCADANANGRIDFPGECAPVLIPGTADTGWRVNTIWNLGTLTGMTTFSPVLTVSYMNYGSNFQPPLGFAGDNFAQAYVVGQFRGWDVILDLTLSPRLTAQFEYSWGTGVCPPMNFLTGCNAYGFNVGGALQTAPFSGWHVNMTYTLARNYTAAFDWFRFDQDVDAGAVAPLPGKEKTGTIYRLSLFYRW